MSRKLLMSGVGFLATATMLLAGCGDDQAGGSGGNGSNASSTSTAAGDGQAGASGSASAGSESASAGASEDSAGASGESSGASGESSGASAGAPSESGAADGASGNPGAVAVDEAKARQLAQEALPGGTVENLALDQTYKPNAAWDVLGTDAQGQKRRLDIDAVTGEVLKNEAATY